jgi:hypothetical protein
LYLRPAQPELRVMRNGARWQSIGVVVFLLALLPRCACDSVPSDALEKCSAAQVFAGHVKTDILFVIDDSASMANEQTTLQAGLDQFIQTLRAAPIANDFQIGVTTTSVASFNGTAAPPQGSLVAPGIMRSSSATLVSDFQSAVIVGTSGSGREQAFAAVQLALQKSAPGGPNEGLIRPGARLAVIMLSDEDDCSGPTDPNITTSADCRTAKASASSTLTRVADVATLLASPILGEQRDVVVAAVVGVAPGTLELSCGPSYCANHACATADDQGDRYVQLLGALGGARTRLASICDANFDQALNDFATAIMSDTLPLEGTPADWRMLVASVTKAGGAKISCRIAPSDASPADRAAAGAIYSAPQAGTPASLTFQGNCALSPGDLVDVSVVCAG